MKHQKKCRAKEGGKLPLGWLWGKHSCFTANQNLEGRTEEQILDPRYLAFFSAINCALFDCSCQRLQPVLYLSLEFVRSFLVEAPKVMAEEENCQTLKDLKWSTSSDSER